MLTTNADGLQKLLDLLLSHGYAIHGPTLRGASIVIDRISSVRDLPVGWSDHHQPGVYGLHKRNDHAFFGYGLGPPGWKRLLFPPLQHISSFKRTGRGFEQTEDGNPAAASMSKIAFLGIRSCELRALAILDKIFLGGLYADSGYRARRERLFTIGVDCHSPAATCFCASMDTGPEIKDSCDIAISELLNADEPIYVLRPGSDAGHEVVAGIAGHETTDAERSHVQKQQSETRAAVPAKVDRVLSTSELLEIFDHPEWDDIAKRCLGCANCTMVCPTCFCSTMEDTTDLTGSSAERWRRWDSCFTADYARVAGGNVRPSTKARYRQWLLHKFLYWQGQFGSTGCVGCGQCITWCPAGIDITSELKVFSGNHALMVRDEILERDPHD